MVVSTMRCFLACLLWMAMVQSSFAFAPALPMARIHTVGRLFDAKDSPLNEGVVELAGEDDDVATTTPTAASPPGATRFISQGEIDPATLNPDMSDPKQARVIIYIIISLIPVLFLIPLMLGSRDLIPLDALPPIEL